MKFLRNTLVLFLTALFIISCSKIDEPATSSVSIKIPVDKLAARDAEGDVDAETEYTINVYVHIMLPYSPSESDIIDNPHGEEFQHPHENFNEEHESFTGTLTQIAAHTFTFDEIPIGATVEVSCNIYNDTEDYYENWWGHSESITVAAGKNPVEIRMEYNKTDKEIPVTSIKFDCEETEIVLNIDYNRRYDIIIEPADATDKTVTWTSDNANVATVDSFGAIHAVAPGEANITVTAANGISATLKVIVPEPFVPVESVTIVSKDGEELKELELEYTKTFVFNSKIAPDNATDKTVIWSSSDENVAKIDTQGTISPVTTGVTFITATAGEKSATIKLIIIRQQVEHTEENEFTKDVFEADCKTNEYNIEEMTEYSIPDKYDAIYGGEVDNVGIFYNRVNNSGCGNLKTLHIPTSITYFKKNAFVMNHKADTIPSDQYWPDIYYDGTLEDWFNITFEDSGASSPMLWGQHLYVNNGTATEPKYEKLSNEVTIPDYIPLIPAGTFKRSDITSVKFADNCSVKTIASWAFQATNITEITIPKSVTCIEPNAFDSCQVLGSVKFEDTTGWKIYEAVKIDENGNTVGEGEAIDLTKTLENNAMYGTAATYLKTTYREKYWIKTTE